MKASPANCEALTFDKFDNSRMQEQVMLGFTASSLCQFKMILEEKIDL